MRRERILALTAAGIMMFAAEAARAMGYDSLACPELAERRIAYFVNNGFCDPVRDPAKKEAKECKPIEPGSEEQLPEADRTQVQMIIRTEGRKACPVK